MSNKVSFVYIARDKYSRVAREVKRVTQQVRNQFRGMTRDVGTATEKFKKYKKQIDSIKKSAVDVGKKMSSHISLPLVAIGTAALVQSAKFENLDIAFETLIGNADKAKKVLNELVQFTATTPFQMDAVANAGRQLLAFGVDANDLTGVLRQLGDLAAGTGKPLEEFSLIFGKIKAKGKVTGEELLQLAEKGIALQTILAKKHGVSQQQIVDAVSKGQVTFDVFKGALDDMTKKGGKFFNLTKEQSKSLGGLFSTLKDAIVLTLKSIGDVMVKQFSLKDVLAKVIVKMNAMAQAIVRFAKEHPSITKFILVFIGLLAVLGPVIIVVAQLASGFAIVALAAGTFGIALSPILLTIGAIILVVGLAVAAFILLKDNWKEISNVVGGTIHHMILNFEAFLAKIVQIKDEIATFGGEVFDKIAGFFGFGGDVDVTQQSRTDVNVNLKAPEGAIQSVKSQTTGKVSGLNVGVNMATAQ